MSLQDLAAGVTRQLVDDDEPYVVASCTKPDRWRHEYSMISSSHGGIGRVNQATMMARGVSTHFSWLTPDQGYLFHLGVAVDDGLDLGGIDVFSARDDHVLLAVDDVDVALVVQADRSPEWNQPPANACVASACSSSPAIRSRRAVDDLADLAPPARRTGPRRRCGRATVGMSWPTEPSLRERPPQSSMQVTGDISVSPERVEVRDTGEPSRPWLPAPRAGATEDAPQLMRRRASRRSWDSRVRRKWPATGSAQSSKPVICSFSIRSTANAGGIELARREGITEVSPRA